MKVCDEWDDVEIENHHRKILEALIKVQTELESTGCVNVDNIVCPILIAGSPALASLWPYPVEELRKSLYDSFYTIKNKQEYNELILLWSLLGGHIWSWHRGYKEPEKGETLEEVGTTYSLNEVGLFKELYNPVASHTLDELKEMVLGIQIPDEVKLNPIKKDTD